MAVMAAVTGMDVAGGWKPGMFAALMAQPPSVFDHPEPVDPELEERAFEIQCRAMFGKEKK